MAYQRDTTRPRRTRRPRKTAFVPRVVFSLAIAGVVPTIGIACGDTSNTVAAGGFAGVAAVAMGGFGGVAAGGFAGVAAGGFAGVAAGGFGGVAAGGFGGVAAGGFGGAGGSGGAGGEGGTSSIDASPAGGAEAPALIDSSRTKPSPRVDPSRRGVTVATAARRGSASGRRRA